MSYHKPKVCRSKVNGHWTWVASLGGCQFWGNWFDTMEEAFSNAESWVQGKSKSGHWSY